ncbi:MAG: hypothetical protein H6R26_2582, partial [Proteobacteria bacterium]|nr:hypothetical protein [Pseudomonadota bacterium]
MIKTPDRLKQKLLEQVKQALAQRLGARQVKLANDYLDSYFRRVPMEELEAESPEVLASIIASGLKFLARRQPGETLI